MFDTRLRCVSIAPSDTPVDDQARGLLTEAMTLFQEADKALREGDLAAYQAKTNSAMEKAEAALKILNP